ncbi:MAG: ion channel [Actinobacteria bacterium]|nr:ion channel [Actinomycetota bacterium]
MLTFITILLGKVKRSQVITLVVLGALAVLIGAALFAATQHVSFGTGVYWAITTATTVGYGDVTPHNAVGRAIATLVMLTAIPLFGAAFAVFAAVMTATRLGKLLGVGQGPPEGEFVAIYGSHHAVPRIAEELVGAGTQVLVVAEENLDALPSQVRTVEGDPTVEEVLRKSKPAQASRLLIANAEDGDSLVTAVMLRHLAPEVPAVAVVQSAKVAQALLDLGLSSTVSAEDLLGHTLAKSLETPHAGELLLRLVGSNGYRLREVAADPGWIGKPLSVVRAQHGGLVLGLAQSDGEVAIGVGHDPVIQAGDSLLVVASEERRLHI